MIEARGPERGQRARRPELRGLAVAGLAVTFACAPRHLPAPRPSLLATTDDGAEAVSPAEWHYHPRTAAALRSRVAVGEAQLLMGDFGERWLVGKRAEAAGSRAPEPLVGARPGGAGWVFFGASGSTYESREPLGDFLHSAAPAVALTHVSASSRAILGLRDGGRMLRSTDLGLTWRDVGPEGPFVVSASLHADGRGLALAVPEALYFSRDHGATWNLGEQKTIGATGITAHESGLFVHGVLDWYAVSDTWPPRLTVAKKPTSSATLTLGKVPPRGPDASAVREGRAVVTGGGYLELVPSRRRAAGLSLLAGPLAGPLKVRALATKSPCSAARIAAHGDHVEVACAKNALADSPEPLTFLRSEDGGRHFRTESLGVRGTLATLRMAVGPGGELVVSGVCPSEAPERGCRPMGILVRGKPTPAEKRPAKAEKAGHPRRPGSPRGPNATPTERWIPAATPSLRGTALALAFGPDGRAYALGRRAKVGGLAVYVAKDGGHTFSAHDLVDRGVGDDDDDAATPDWSNDDEDGSGFSVDAFRVDDDGSLAVVLRQWSAITYYVLDADGRPLSSASPPGEADALGATGRRALAYTMSDGTAWETLDGGASWQRASRMSTRSCLEAQSGGDGSCDVAVACEPGGCLVGAELTRIGWRVDPARAMEGALPPAEIRAPRPLRWSKTPIGCTLDPEDWRPLAHASAAPSADQAAIGDVAWFTPAEDPARGAAGAYNARGGAQPRVEYVSLLGAATRPSEVAMYVSRQIEGVAVLRYRVPTGADPNLTAVEIGWQNLFDGTVQRAELGRPEPYRPGDFRRTGAAVERATPALLSIASGGIYLRIHGSTGDNQVSYFLDGRSVAEVPAIAWPPASRARGHAEIAHLDRHTPFLVTDRGTALVRATLGPTEPTFAAIALGVDQPASLGLEPSWELAYHGKQVGLAVRLVETATDRRRGWFHPLLAEGAVTGPSLPLPDQSALADPPRACSDAERQGSPRTVTGFSLGTRHPVVVNEAHDPQRVLMTNQAVLHGAPERACVAAFDATGIATSRSEAEMTTAILPPGDLEHSWLFRSVQGDPPQGLVVEVRPMACRFEPDLEVPEEVYRQAGARPGR